MIMDKKKILSLATNDQDKLILSKIIDVAQFATSKNTVKCTNFLNGHQVMLAKKAVLSLGVKYEFFGGYSQSERAVLLCCPDWHEPSFEDYPISIIHIKNKGKTVLSHRDYMGAILNLGINRDKVGDIVVNDSSAYIMCITDIAEYILSNIEKIGRSGVEVTVSATNQITVPPKKFKEIKASVSSVRLDSVVAEAIGVSRNEASTLVENGLVSVNWEVKTKCDFKLTEGDLLSVHGHGRVLFDKIVGTSKKGRIFIELKRYI